MRLWMWLVAVAHATTCSPTEDDKLDDTVCRAGSSAEAMNQCCIDLCNTARCACEEVSPDVPPGPGCYAGISGNGGVITWFQPSCSLAADTQVPVECHGTCVALPPPPDTCNRWREGTPPACDP